MPKTLVTGSPGWLGTRLVQVLVRGDPEIGTFEHYPERQVRCLVLPGIDVSVLEAMSVEIVFGDIRKPETLSKAVNGIDTIFHCAGVIHPKRVKDFYDINTIGTKNLLAAAKEAGVRRFIYVSSNSVAGVNTHRSKLMTEVDSPRPYKHYGKSKLLAEKAVLEACKSGALESVVIRPCWYYGPGQPERQTQLFRMIKYGKVPLFGNGENLRSMSYIDNAIMGLLLAEKSEIAKGKIYWIADSEPYSTIEIYRVIAKLLEVKLKFRKIPKSVSKAFELLDTMIQGLRFYSSYIHVAGEMAKDIACSIDLARSELGYEPKIGLEEGMRRSIEWCRAHGIDI